MITRLLHLLRQMRPIDVFASGVALVSATITQPTAQLLSTNGEFFISRSATRLEVALTGIVLIIVVPVFGAACVWATHKIPGRIGPTLYAAITALLMWLFTVRGIESVWPDLRTRFTFPVAAVVALGVVVLLARSDGVRTFALVAAFGPLLVLGQWLLFAQTSTLIFSDGDLVAATSIDVSNPHPVILLIFDELPLSSLIDGDGTIQASLYPGFERLASDSIWFRNAITVEGETSLSLPAILTGNRSRGGQTLAVRSNYPDNLFTLLEGTYAIDANEPVTLLCPERTCPRSMSPTTAQGDYSTLVSDVIIVGKHVVLPDVFTKGLPPIDITFGNFGQQLGADEDFDPDALFRLEVLDDRRLQAEQILDGLVPAGDRPTFNFGHVLIPHAPWNFLASGQAHDAPSTLPGADGHGWNDDDWLLTQAYQQHLAQVQYADTILSDVIDRLRQLGTYDDTLLIVLSDHGTVMRNNIEARRAITPDTVDEMAPIPMFIKLPGSTSGSIDDYRAETLDLLPTIADVLGINLPWNTEGVSLVSGARPQRTQSVVNPSNVVMGVDGETTWLTAAARLERFGNDGIFNIGPEGSAALLGSRIATLEPSTRQSTARVGNLRAFSDIDLGAELLPVHLRGTVSGQDATSSTLIAVSVNDTVVAVTRTFVQNDSVRFHVLIPPSSLVDGANVVTFASVERTATGWSAAPIDTTS